MFAVVKAADDDQRVGVHVREEAWGSHVCDPAQHARGRPSYARADARNTRELNQSGTRPNCVTIIQFLSNALAWASPNRGRKGKHQ